jgi:RNA ligase (TIGR02306 family)
MTNEIVRKLASVKEVTSVKPIPGADFIEAVVVDGGWQVVERKGRVSVGELVVYAEPDSFIPFELAPFLSEGKEPREYNGVKGERLRTVKLKKTLSQGLIFKLSDLPEAILGGGLNLGEDLTEALGITKWEAPIPACLSGQVRGNFPSWIQKTDQERVQNLNREVFQDHKEEKYEVTVKLDGSSCTIYVKDGVVGVCSRNLDLTETEGNSFWSAARGQKIVEGLEELHALNGSNIALQMELIGEGIQGNQEGIKGHRLYLFDVFLIDEQRYMEPTLRRLFLKEILIAMFGMDLEHVPVLEEALVVTDQFSNQEEILAYADGPSMNPSVKREGVVFKSEDSPFTFKAISNKWLLKNQDK